MKRLFTLLYFLLILLNGYSQSFEPEVTNQTLIIGKNHVSRADIRGTAYIFGNRIHHTYIDGDSKTITFLTRDLSRNKKSYKNKGELLLFDPQEKSVRWSQPVNYMLEEVADREGVLLKAVGYKSSRIDKADGSTKWEVSNPFYHVDSKRNIGLGFRYKAFSGFSNSLEGIDLTDGQVRWKREMNHKYGWNGVVQQNDSVVIVLANGLHAVNLKTGQGWDYPAVTGSFDYTKMVASGVASLALVALTASSGAGGTTYAIAPRDLIGDLLSNLLKYDEDYYFASAENITRLDATGQVVWEQKLPSKCASNSSIFIADSLLYMVNNGFGFNGSRKVGYGKPFIAAFDLKTGNQKFLTLFEEKKQQVAAYKIVEDTIVMAFKNKVSKLSLKDGGMIEEKELSMDSLKSLRYFVDDLVFLNKNGKYQNLTTIDSTRHYIWTEGGKIAVLNNHLEMVDMIDDSEIYNLYLETRGYRFIACGDATVVLDRNDRVVAELKLTARAIKMGNTLYDVQEEQFVEVDLDQVIGHLSDSDPKLAMVH